MCRFELKISRKITLKIFLNFFELFEFQKTTLEYLYRFQIMILDSIAFFKIFNTLNFQVYE